MGMMRKRVLLKKLFIASIILNILLFGILCFGTYYKRASIVRHINSLYFGILNKNIENTISVLNQSPYETNVKYINNNQFEKSIKIAILGNSISLHGIIEGLWDYESGMAASDLEHDYVHLLINKISMEKQCGIEYIVINISDFERNFENFNLTRLEKVREFNPEIIIFQIGENISTEMLKLKGEVFFENYKKIIEYCNGKDTVVCLPFWPAKETINLITEVALKSGVYLVDLSHLGSGIDYLNFASSEKKYKHTGVAAHPGNYGMKNIAEMIYITINKIIE